MSSEVGWPRVSARGHPDWDSYSLLPLPSWAAGPQLPHVRGVFITSLNTWHRLNLSREPAPDDPISRVGLLLPQFPRPPYFLFLKQRTLFPKDKADVEGGSSAGSPRRGERRKPASCSSLPADRPLTSSHLWSPEVGHTQGS